MRVLLAEDDTSISEPLSRALRREGYEVDVTADGPSTLDKALGEGIDLILLDIGLPGMDGYELARRLRALPGGESLVLVAVTGYGQREDRSKALAAGFDAHLTKPYTYAEVAQALTAARRGPPGLLPPTQQAA